MDIPLHNHNTIITHDQIHNDVLAPNSSVHNQITPDYLKNTLAYVYLYPDPDKVPTLHSVVRSLKYLHPGQSSLHPPRH